MPPDFRLAVVLADLEDFSYKEIAEIMDCPAGTVMSRLYRGRKILQGLLYDYAVEQGIIAPARRRRRRPTLAGDTTRPKGEARRRWISTRIAARSGADGRGRGRMNCAEATATVQAYIDGELDGVDRESVERHLVGCAGCSRRVHVQTRFRAAVRAHLHRPEVPFALRRRIEEALGVAADRAAALAGLDVVARASCRRRPRSFSWSR